MSSVAEIYEIALFMIHQIFCWAGDWSKLITSLYIPQLFPQLKLGDIQGYHPSEPPQFSKLMSTMIILLLQLDSR